MALLWRGVGLLVLWSAVYGGGEVSSFMPVPGAIRGVRGRALHASDVPEEPPGGGRDWASKVKRSSRLNKSNKPPEKEPKKEQPKFTKDHFYQGPVAVGTYAWGDPRRGFYYGPAPSKAIDRAQMMCGAFNEQDIEEAFTFLEEQGLPLFDARELYPCEGLLGDVTARWKKRQLQLNNDVKQIRPFVATSYRARLFGSSLWELRGGRRALMKALEKSLEQLQATRVDLFQVTRPNALYVGGEKAVFEACATAKQLRLMEHVGLIGYTGEQLVRARMTAKGFGIDVKSNSVELSLANPAPLLDGTLEACQREGVLAFANRPLAGGLLSGYTMADPTGGRSGKPRFDFKELEPLYPVHKAQREVAKKYSDRLLKRISTAQVAINWVRAKGAVPLVGVNRAAHAKDLFEATKWELDKADVDELERVAVEVFKKRNRIKAAVRRVRG